MDSHLDTLVSTAVRIRPYQDSDFSVLQTILVEAFQSVSIDHAIELEVGPIEGHDWKWRKGRDLAVDLDRDRDGVLVADVEGWPVGYISTWQDAKAGIGHIPNLVVAREHRGRGIGRRLIEAAIARFRSADLAQGDCAMIGNLQHLANRFSREVDGQLRARNRNSQGGGRCREQHRQRGTFGRILVS